MRLRRGAAPGERCRPLTVLMGFHLNRIRRAGLEGNVALKRAEQVARRARKFGRVGARW